MLLLVTKIVGTPKNTPLPKLSDELVRLSRVCDKDPLVLSQLIRALRSRGHAVITLFMSFPFMLPVPLPGLSMLLGAIIILCGIRISAHARPWIPRKWRKRKISGKLLIKVFHVGERVVRKFERVTRPRWRTLATDKRVITTSGIMLAVCGLLLSLPYPPGTNFPPAIAIILISLGVLEEDFLFIALGFLAFIFNIFFFAAITFYGVEAIQWIWQKVSL
jgi:hypothetical protein